MFTYLYIYIYNVPNVYAKYKPKYCFTWVPRHVKIFLVFILNYTLFKKFSFHLLKTQEDDNNPNTFTYIGKYNCSETSR